MARLSASNPDAPRNGQASAISVAEGVGARGIKVFAVVRGAVILEFHHALEALETLGGVAQARACGEGVGFAQPVDVGVLVAEPDIEVDGAVGQELDERVFRRDRGGFRGIAGVRDGVAVVGEGRGRHRRG